MASFTADQYAEITVGTLVNAATMAPVVRGSATVNTQYFCLASGPLGASVTFQLFKKVAGTATQLGTNFSHSLNTGDVFRLHALGTTIAVSVNGTVIFSQTDASIANGTPGLFCGPSAATSDATITNWTGGNVTAGPTFTPVATDNFQRGDENPLSIFKWSNQFGYGSLQIVSKVCEASAVTGSMEIYFTTQYWDTLLSNASVLAADSFKRGAVSGNAYNGNWLQPNTTDALVQTTGTAIAPGTSSVPCTSIYTNVTNTQNAGGTSGGLPAGAMWPNDQWCSAKVGPSMGAGDVFGLLLRSDQGNTTQTYYLFFVVGVGGAQTMTIRKYVSGAITNLSTTTGAVAVGDFFTFSVQGTTLKVSQNGTNIAALNATDATITSGSPGVFFNGSTASASLVAWRGGGFNLATPSPFIVFIGDSIISRWDLAQQFAGNAYCNCGIGSQTSTNILSRFDIEVVAQAPVWVVIEGGRNGFQQGTETVAQTEANWLAMANKARAAGIGVIWTTTISDDTNIALNTKIDQLNAWVPTVAVAGEKIAGWNAAVDAQTVPTSAIPANYIGDLIHPNTTGYALMATAFNNAPIVSNYYSVPDCRIAPFGPNAFRTVQNTKIYDVQTSSNSAVPSKDSRVSGGVPVDSRTAGIIPSNSRVAGTFGPGE